MSPRRLGRLAIVAHEALLGLCAAVGVLWVVVLLALRWEPGAYLFLAVTVGGVFLRLGVANGDLQSVGWRLRRRLYACRVRPRRGIR